jgi:hypothetical protein
LRPFNLNVLLLGVPKRKRDGRVEEVASEFVLNPRACCTHGTGKKYKVLLGKPERKRPIGRRRHRREDGIRMYLREIGRGCELDSTSSG